MRWSVYAVIAVSLDVRLVSAAGRLLSVWGPVCQQCNYHIPLPSKWPFSCRFARFPTDRRLNLPRARCLALLGSPRSWPAFLFCGSNARSHLTELMSAFIFCVGAAPGPGPFLLRASSVAVE